MFRDSPYRSVSPTKKKGTTMCGAPYSASLAPPAFTAPCRNQTGELPMGIASLVPGLIWPK
jgi:hypothetical protein